jgi:hypothetical protein
VTNYHQAWQIDAGSVAASPLLFIPAVLLEFLLNHARAIEKLDVALLLINRRDGASSALHMRWQGWSQGPAPEGHSKSKISRPNSMTVLEQNNRTTLS